MDGTVNLWSDIGTTKNTMTQTAGSEPDFTAFIPSWALLYTTALKGTESPFPRQEKDQLEFVLFKRTIIQT